MFSNKKKNRSYTKEKRDGFGVCAQFGEEDGIDPRHLARAKASRNRHKRSRKTSQLCKQVERLLTTLITGGMGDPRFQAIFVEAVIPEPDASRLRVFVCLASDGMDLNGIDELQDFLKEKKGFFRSEIGRGIHRKRIPELLFSVRPVQF